MSQRSADRSETGTPDPASARGAEDRRLPLSEPLYKRVFHEIGNDDVPGQAAKVAFFMFTSLPPALLVLFGLTGYFGGEAVGEYITSRIQSAMPGSADDPGTAAGFLASFVDQVVSQTAPGPFSIGLIVGIWTGSTVFVALADSLNKAYDSTEDRSWLRRRALAIGVMIAFLLLFVAGSLVLIIGPQIAGALQLGGVANLAWSILQWPLAFLLVVGAFYLVYYVLPNRDQSSLAKVLLKSSAIAAALWLIVTIGFRFYVSNFGSYGETYGFVGAILVLLLWMYLTAMVVLVGGEISSELEREAGG
ncbi:MAG: YihY/virulence factor BrkB family protein [Gemmatimonadota bacterium]